MNWKKLLVGTWSWKRPFYTIGFVYGLFLLIALFGADMLIFKPPLRAETALPSHFISFPSGDGETIAAYYLPPKEGMPVLLWSHGNAEDLGDLYYHLKDFHQLGYGIMAYDYPGYGFSSGKPTEAGCFSAITAAYDHLTGPLGQPAERIILTGQSVGTGPTCYLATEKEHAGVILIAPFTSAFRTLTRIPLYPNDRFQNIYRIGEMTQPLLIIHGADDGVIGQWHGRKLHELSPANDKRFLSVEGAGHNNLFDVGPAEIETAMEEFAKQVYSR
ncbi:alpha/beta hydrolase [Akkermansiaceae bacterium]|nr:alpha/beta hydrolase [Akkermansiaceae bacterium]MDB4266080.1 alpha/beta hydrolase [bacterium]MDA8876061.1 alpha/beta hydrolase [Akkermansiaceae bacterium]MDB4421410.1 alpha/beta hydrolase [Akkermansiaceae bacterium]MDB4508575.1 alpha/beta hydrolase [Akkermansiaceae bacterium]